MILTIEIKNELFLLLSPPKLKSFQKNLKSLENKFSMLKTLNILIKQENKLTFLHILCKITNKQTKQIIPVL